MDRQKKILIFVLAWVSALGLTWFLYSTTIAPKAERHTRVLVAAHDMPLGTLIRRNDVKLVNYPEKDVPKAALTQTKDAESRVLLYPLSANEPVLLTKLSGTTSMEGVSSTIEAGFRAVAVQITDVTGVAGLIMPNSRVDVLFTHPGVMAEATTSTILQDVKVLSVGRLLPAGQTADPRAPKSPVVTLLLIPADAQKLELAKSEGKISLSLRNPLDSSRTASADPTTTDVLDPAYAERVARARKGRTNPAPKEDPKVWQALLAKQTPPPKPVPEKPKAVVDVYHGDKHVQESFK